MLILSVALMLSGPLGRHGVYKQSAHLWATVGFFQSYEVLWTLEAAGKCSQCAHLWATVSFVPCCESSETAKTGGVL